MQMIKAMKYNFCPRCGRSVTKHEWDTKMVPNGHHAEKFGLCKDCSEELERDRHERFRHFSRSEFDELFAAFGSERGRHDPNEAWKKFLGYRLNVVLDYQNNVQSIYYNLCSTIYGKPRENKGFVMKDPWSGQVTGRNY